MLGVPYAVHHAWGGGGGGAVQISGLIRSTPKSPLGYYKLGHMTISMVTEGPFLKYTANCLLSHSL